jgi:hypothetical protein
MSVRGKGKGFRGAGGKQMRKHVGEGRLIWGVSFIRLQKEEKQYISEIMENAALFYYLLHGIISNIIDKNAC